MDEEVGKKEKKKRSKITAVDPDERAVGANY